MSRKSYKWYVYHLIDPRCGNVFYVGKGSGDRDRQHFIEHGTEKAINHAKNTKIKSILGSGLNVGICRVAYFNCEIEAYNFESEQICSFDGLTNIARNKKRSRIISLMGEVRKAIYGKGDMDKVKSNLLMFSGFKDATPDHLKLIQAGLNMINFQAHINKV